MKVLNIHDLNINTKYKLLKNFNLSLEKGTILGLVEVDQDLTRNIVEAIMTGNKYTSGQIHCFNEDISTQREYVKRIGVVRYSPQFYNNMTLEKNLKLHCECMGYYNTSSILPTLSQLDLSRYSDVPIKNIPKRYYKAIGLARAMITKPELIILDDIFTDFDDLYCKKVKRLILKMNQIDNITFLITSHRINDLEFLVDNVAFIIDGQVTPVESVASIKKRYTNYFEFSTSQPKEASVLLSELAVDFHTNGDDTFRIYNNKASNKLIHAMIEANIQINSFRSDIVSLENYYEDRLGGLNEHHKD